MTAGEQDGWEPRDRVPECLPWNRARTLSEEHAMDRAQRGRKAFTIPELLVVFFLFLIVLAMMMQLFVPSLALFRIQNARSEVQQAPLVCTRWLQAHLANSMLDTLTVLYSPAAISFVAINEADPYDASTGSPKLEKRFVVLWHDKSAGMIKYREWPPVPPRSPGSVDPAGYQFDFSRKPLSLTAQDLGTIINEAGTDYHVLARNVEKFTVDDADGDATAIINPPLRFSVLCSAPSRARGTGQEDEKSAMSMQVTPRTLRW